MPLRILAKNILDGVAPSILTGTPVTGYPASNALTARRSEVSRITSVSAGSGFYVGRVWYALPADARANMIVAARTNLPNAGYLQGIAQTAAFSTLFQADTSGLGAGDGDLDVMSDESARGINNHAVYSAGGTIYSTVRNVYFDLLTNVVTGVVEHGRAFAGVYKELALNFDWGNTVEWVDPGTSTATYGGDLIATYGGPPRRKIFLPFSGVPATDRAYLFDLMRVVGTSGELFISEWPGSGGRLERDHQMWCRIANTDALRQSHVDFYGASITFIEC